MRAGIVDLLQVWLGRAANLKISSYRSFQALLRQDRELFEQVAALNREVNEFREQLQRQHADHAQQIQRRAAEHAQHIQQQEADYSRQIQEYREQAAFLRTQLYHLKSPQRHEHQPKQRDNRGKQRAVVVMTAVSQMAQVRMLAAATLIRRAYDLIVVSYVETEESGLLDFCAKSGLTLLSHRLGLLCGDPFYKAFDEFENPEMYFGASALFEDLPADDRRLLEHTNSLLAEIHRQHTVAIKSSRFLLQTGATIIILFEDNAEYDTGVWTSIARLLSIPVAILPYTIADRIEPAETHLHDPRYWADEGILNRFAKSVLPRWLFFYRDRWLLRRRVLPLLASESLGYAQPDPWILNSSKANVIGVESTAMYRHYVHLGIDEARLEMVGSVSDDLLYEALRNSHEVRDRLALDANRPTLLCGFPPNQLTAAGRPECEFQDFKQIVDAWLGALLRLKNWQVVIKPHPAMLRADIDYLRTFGFPVTDMDTTSLIAVCDLFNTSVSSTIRWALACGKPVLNYDVYRYRYQDFVNEAAVVTVVTFEDFSKELAKITGDPSVLQGYADKAKAAAERWGMLDGHSTERILRLLDRLTLGDKQPEVDLRSVSSADARQTPSLSPYQQANS